MRSPGHRLRFDKSCFTSTLLSASLIALNDPEARLGRFTAFVIYHCTMLMPDVGAQRMLRNLLLPFWIPFDDRMIGLLRLMILKLDIQRPMRFCITRKDNYPARYLVQAVDDIDLPISVLQQSDEILRFLLPSIGQDGESGGFVQHD